MVAALQWVHNNIALFGGDPENITIFGQSGGGMKVADLMQIADADGLFHKSLIMSGVNCATLSPACTGDGYEIVTALLKELGLSENQVEKLETIPYYELANAYLKVSPAIAMQGGYIGGAPLVGDYYKGNPLDYGFRERAFETPIMIGSVFGEFAFMPADYDKNNLSKEQIKTIVSDVYKEHTDEIMKRFEEAYPGKIQLMYCWLIALCGSHRNRSLRCTRRNQKQERIYMILRWSFQFITIRLHGIVRIFHSFSII